MSNTNGNTASDTPTAKPKVNLFDIRNIIGALLFLYGVILLITSFTTSTAQKAKADGINANLWVGIVLIVVGLLFLLWGVARPIAVDPQQVEADKEAVDKTAHESLEGGTGDR